MKKALQFVVVLAALCVFAPSAYSQQQFGVDAENLDVSKCNHNIGCPLIDMAVQAGAHWMRLLAIWHFLEPQQNVFNWGELPWQVWYAQQRGIQIYFTATWAPQWANGASSICAPYAGANQFNSNGVPGPECQFGYQDVGRTVTNSNYTWTFFNNLALQFNGSNTSGCPSGDPNTCHPLVQYFGVWNEPDGMNNFNDASFSNGNLGNYLNDYATQFLFPAYNGVKAANPSAFVVAADLGTGDGISCGGFSNCPSWNDSWIQPLARYFSGSYDIVSIHGYHADHVADKTALQKAFNSATGKQIWLTETAYSNSADVTGLFVDQHNLQATWNWTKVFYSFGGYRSCGGASTLLCSNDGNTLQTTAFFTAYQQVYAPH